VSASSPDDLEVTMDDDNMRAERARRGSPYLNTAQAAHFLGVSKVHLERLRSRGEGPLWRRHATMALYHIGDLERWSLSRAKGQNQ
jgi:hypothetical protein